MSLKLKKLSVILISAIILIAIIILAIFFFKKDNDIKDVNTSTSEITESYNDSEDNKTKNTLSLPDDVLSNMSTDNLIEKILEYSFIDDGEYFASSNPTKFMDKFDLSYSSLRELSQRSDACEILMEKYKNEPLPLAANNPDANAENMDSSKLENMGFLFCKDFIIQTLDENKIKELSKIIIDKYEISQNPPEGYSSHGENPFFRIMNITPNLDEVEKVFTALHNGTYTVN